MVAVHFIAKMDENRRTVDRAKNMHASGLWDIPASVAERLVGGRLYLHKKKAKNAFHGGTITGYRVVKTDYAHSDRIEFDYVMDDRVKSESWHGSADPRAWWSGVIE